MSKPATLSIKGKAGAPADSEGRSAPFEPSPAIPLAEPIRAAQRPPAAPERLVQLNIDIPESLRRELKLLVLDGLTPNIRDFAVAVLKEAVIRARG